MNITDYLAWLYAARDDFYDSHEEYHKFSSGHFFFDEEHYRHSWFAKFDEEIKKIEGILWNSRQIKCLPCTHFIAQDQAPKKKPRKKVLA